MMCPFCNTQMEQGYIQSTRQFFYTKNKKALFFVPSNDDIELSEGAWSWRRCIAYHCENCKKILIDYDSE